jgi:hypothetical protein
MTASRYLRVFWAVFMAVVGTVCVPGGAFAATSDRAAEMARQGCCCPGMSAPDCCCETKTDVGLTAPAAERVDGFAVISSAAPRIEPARTGQCKCNVGPPASPASRSQSNLSEGRKDTGTTLHLKVFAASTRPATAFRRNLASRGDPPDSPLYLRNSRLLI